MTHSYLDGVRALAAVRLQTAPKNMPVQAGKGNIRVTLFAAPTDVDVTFWGAQPTPPDG